VESAALLREIIAVPAEPEKPEMNSAIGEIVSRQTAKIEITGDR
jgi:hypothetical protein